MPSSPLWLLDIDGVVNALAMGLPTQVWAEPDWVQRTVVVEVPDRGVMTLPILAARPVLAFVGEVHRSGTAEVRWHSTWRATAVTGLAPVLGLPPIPISVAPEWQQQPDGWWKLPAAQRAVSAGRRLVWTDDDIDRWRGDPRAAAALDALDASPDVLLLSVSPATGLTPHNLEQIAAFLEEGS